MKKIFELFESSDRLHLNIGLLRVYIYTYMHYYISMINNNLNIHISIYIPTHILIEIDR